VDKAWFYYIILNITLTSGSKFCKIRFTFSYTLYFLSTEAYRSKLKMEAAYVQ